MKKYLYGIIAIFLLIGAVYFSFEKDATNVAPSVLKKETITVGIMMPLSGDFGAIGEGLGKASKLAIKDWEKSHPNIDVRVIQEDDKFDVKTGISAYTKLTTLDHVDGLVMVSTPVLDAMNVQMKKDNLPIMSVGLQNEGIAKDNIFQLTPDPNAAIKKLAEYVQSNGNVKKLAIVHANTAPALTAFYNTFTSNYKSDSVEFMINSVDDAKSIATKIKSANVDGIVVMTMPGTGALLTKNLLQLGVDPQKTKFYYDAQLSSGWAEYEKQLGDMKKLDGSISLQFSTSDLTAFKTKFKAEYGTDPAVFSEYGYDGTMALLNAHAYSVSEWTSAIGKTNVDGFSGKMSFDTNGVRIQDAEMWKMSGGKLVKM